MSTGAIENSSGGLFAVLPTSHRTPGQYKQINAKTGVATSVPMRDTNERVHVSVRARVKLEGPGVGGKGTYKPEALEGFELVGKRWELRRPDGSASDVVLEEEGVGRFELQLLRRSPRVCGFVTGKA